MGLGSVVSGYGESIVSRGRGLTSRRVFVDVYYRFIVYLLFTNDVGVVVSSPTLRLYSFNVGVEGYRGLSVVERVRYSQVSYVSGYGLLLCRGVSYHVVKCSLQ